MSKGKSGPAIGIDLGTTYSCVGVFQHGKVEIIANDQGNRTTPSYVAFTDSERLIGDAAKNQVAMNPNNTVFGKYFSLLLTLNSVEIMVIFAETENRNVGISLSAGSGITFLYLLYVIFFVTDAKRMIGRKFSDNDVQQDMKHWSFTVVDDLTKPKIQVEYKNETKTFYPEEVRLSS